MKIKVRLSEINLEKEKPLLVEVIDDFFKVFRAARAAARLRAIRGLWQGPIRVAKAADGGGEFISFSRTARTPDRVQNLVDRSLMPDSPAYMGDENVELLRKALQNTEGSVGVQILDVTPPGSNSKRFLAIGMSDDGPAIIGRAAGPTAESRLTKHFEDITKANADAFLRQVSLNPANVVVDSKTAELATLGKNIDGDEYTALSRVLDDLVDTEKITPEDRELYASRLEFRLNEPPAAYDVSDVDAMDSAGELIDFENRMRLRVETGFDDIDEINPLLLRIQQRLADLGRADELERVNDARRSLSDVGITPGVNLDQLRSAEEVDRAMEVLNRVEDDIPADEVERLRLALQARRAAIGADDAARAADDTAEAGDDAARAGDDTTTEPPLDLTYKEITRNDFPIREYKTKEAAEEVAESYKRTGGIFGFFFDPMMAELRRFGKGFKLVPENAPAFREDGKLRVYVITEAGNVEDIPISDAEKLIDQVKASKSVLKDGLSAGAKPGVLRTYWDEVRDFAYFLPPADASKARKLISTVGNAVLGSGNVFINPIITTTMRRLGFSTSNVIVAKRVLYYGYVGLATITVFTAWDVKRKELQEKAKLAGKYLSPLDAAALAFGPMLQDPEVVAYMDIIDPEWLQKTIDRGTMSKKELAALEKITVKRGAFAQRIANTKAALDKVPRAVARLSGLAIYSLPWPSWSNVEVGAEQIQPELEAIAAEEAEVSDSKVEAREEIKNLEAIIDAVPSDYYDVRNERYAGKPLGEYIRKIKFRNLEEDFAKFDNAKKAGYVALLNFYLEWAEKTVDGELEGRVRKLKREAVKAAADVKGETANESIIALPTLGNLRVRIKK